MQLSRTVIFPIVAVFTGGYSDLPDLAPFGE
jgi:hypothetical protein